MYLTFPASLLGTMSPLLIAYCIFFSPNLLQRNPLRSSSQLKSVNSFGEYFLLDSLQNKRADSPLERAPGAPGEEREFGVWRQPWGCEVSSLWQSLTLAAYQNHGVLLQLRPGSSESLSIDLGQSFEAHLPYDLLPEAEAELEKGGVSMQKPRGREHWGKKKTMK